MAPTNGGVTIGQAAAFAGVTVKTVRHYHQHGLLDEPPRDTSGYRRYGSADLCCGWSRSGPWAPDDPRIDELASALAGNLLANRELLAVPAGFQSRPDTATLYGLINHHREDRAAWARLNALVEAKLRAADVPIPHQ